MLTEKELLELGDLIASNMSLIEKYEVYAQQCPDPQVRELLNRHQQVIQNHYQTLAGLLQNSQNQNFINQNQTRFPQLKI